MGEFWRHAKILESIDWKLISATTLRGRRDRDPGGSRHTPAGAADRPVSRARQPQDPGCGANQAGRDSSARVFRYVAGFSTLLIAGMLVLSEIGVSIGPILGAGRCGGRRRRFRSAEPDQGLFHRLLHPGGGPDPPG